jgi:NodT family efflux transporter outer membrane factor (OMF) lipoprotein
MTKGNFRKLRWTHKILMLSLPIMMALSLTIIGCAVGPDYKRPQAPEPKEWIEKEDPKIKSESADFSQWWTAFKDPVLNNLIEMAYQQNLTLRIAGIRILEARAQLGIATGTLYPQVQAGRGGYTRSSLSENTANTTPNLDFNYGDVDVGFDAAWELDFWGKFRRAVESGFGNLDASVASYDDILVTLSADVARTYVLIRTTEERLAIARENVRIQTRSLEIAEARFEGGAVTELDVQQAKSLLRDTEALIPRLKSSLRQFKNALSTLLGTLPGQVDDILSGSRSIPMAPAEVTVGIPADLLRRRPDIRFAERQRSIGLRASDSDLTAAGFPDGSSFSDLWDSDSIEFFGGAVFSWDIFNYGRIKNRVRVQDARFQQLVVNYQDTVIRAAQEMEDAMVAFLRTQEEVKFLFDSVKAATRSVDLSLIQYREGLVDYQRVLDTQRFKTFEQDLLTEREGDVALNLISMYKALGGGWQIRIGKDFVSEATKAEMQKRTNWGKLISPEKLETPPDKERQRWRSFDW